jgi:nucleoprotein TPR
LRPFIFIQADVAWQYDRTDPAEIQTLKDEIETLKTQKADVEKLAAEREERAKTIQDRVHNFFLTITPF